MPKGGTFVVVYQKNPPLQGPIPRPSGAELSKPTPITDNPPSALEGHVGPSRRPGGFDIDSADQKSNEIVADFCLPYLCCSDTSSIKYIVFAELKIDLPAKICDHHEKYTIKYAPVNATLHDGDKPEGPELRKQEGTGHYYIVPKDMDLGDHKIVIKLGDKSTTYSFQIVEHPDAQFPKGKPVVDKETKQYVWTFTANTKKADWSYAWYIREQKGVEVKDIFVGEGQTYTHKLTIQKEPITFTLCLKVSNGVCVDESQQEVSAKPAMGFLRRMLGDDA